MRKNLTQKLLFCVAASLPLSTAHAEPKTLTIEADTYCPINCAAGEENAGVGVDLAKKIFEPLGYTIKYVVVPWPQALKDVRSGKADAVVGANRQDDPNFIFPKNPIYFMTDNFYVMASNPWKFQGVNSLAEKRVGVIKDYGYDADVMHYIHENKAYGTIMEESGDDALPQNILKLQARHIDVLIESKSIMDYQLKKLNLVGDIKEVGHLDQGNTYIAFSPVLSESRERVKQYDEGIAALKASGKLGAIYGAYGLTPP